MPRLGEFLPHDGDPLMTVIVQWSAVVGKRSRRLLFPRKYDAFHKVLYVAVPNSMVRAQYEPLLPLIIEKMAQVVPEVPVQRIALSVDPRWFPAKERIGADTPPPPPEPDPAQVAAAEQRLLEAGVSPRFASVLARIEVLRNQRRDEDR